MPDAPADAEIELELSYVVTEARWESGYDVRLRDDTVTVTWHGLITQGTGEDWPECELTLSTARPAATVSVPELGPWFLDRAKPVRAYSAIPPGAFGSAAAGGSGIESDSAAFMPRMTPRTATLEQGAAAATYRPGRPVAVPADTIAHRTTITRLELDTVLDYVTAPVTGEEAYLRATVVNTSDHTLRPGKASVFHETEFVGTTRLASWAPGEELELALGVDERIRVERELVRRAAGKGTLSGTKRREAQYRTKVTNNGPRKASVTVLDQVPVSRDEAITVRDVHSSPEAAESTDMGEFSWRLELPPGRTGEITLAFRVDVAKGVELAGWRE